MDPARRAEGVWIRLLKKRDGLARGAGEQVAADLGEESSGAGDAIAVARGRVLMGLGFSGGQVIS
ncbi:MAG: hypothetical protein CMJ31_13875 [Phycisphaerae bacterium]|nr:hypothetical protein [Phycisphaerae bacterium]